MTICPAAVGKNAGFTVNVQQTPFAALIPSLTSNKIDIIAAAMLKTAARAQIVDFSDPVYSYGEGLFVNAEDKHVYKTLDDLKGEIIGAQVGTVFVDALNKKGGFKEVRVYDSLADMMRARYPTVEARCVDDFRSQAGITEWLAR